MHACQSMMADALRHAWHLEWRHTALLAVAIVGASLPAGRCEALLKPDCIGLQQQDRL